MTLRWILLGCALAACGDHPLAAPDAGPAAEAPAPCGAVFRDNFAETWAGPADCARVGRADGHATLAFAIPSRAIAGDLAIAIDLGAAPVPGTYSSQGLTSWRASAVRAFDGTACFYDAGSAAVPAGSLRLALDAIDPVERRAHGTLDLIIYVLSRPYTYCGESNVERVTLTF